MSKTTAPSTFHVEVIEKYPFYIQESPEKNNNSLQTISKSQSKKKKRVSNLQKNFFNFRQHEKPFFNNSSKLSSI